MSVMFKNLIDRLFGEAASSTSLDGLDAEIAVAALLVRVARADDHYDRVERSRIERILRHQHGLSEEAARERRENAEMLEAEAPDTVRFTRKIKDRIPLELRSAIIGAMWQVGLADGQRDAEEDALIRLVSSLLGVSDRDSAFARQEVERAEEQI